MFVETFTEVHCAYGIHPLVLSFLKMLPRQPDTTTYSAYRFCSMREFRDLHVSDYRLMFLYGTQMLLVIFFHLPDRLELKGWCQEANNRILILYNPLSTCLCCFQAKDFASPMGASVFQVQNQVFHQSFLDTV